MTIWYSEPTKIHHPLPAYHMFDEMSSQPELFTGGVLRITVHHVYYSVTEETLQQVFAAYGVVKVSLFQRIHHLEAVVQLRSRVGAARALALHGRCVYEHACLLDIQDVSSEYNMHLCLLLELKQTATVAEYTTAFWEQVHRVLDLNSTISIQCFVHQYVKGLRADIQAAMQSQLPSSITRASSLARIKEEDIVKDAARAVEELDGCIGHGVQGLTPKETLTGVSPKLASHVVRGADHGVVAIDTSSLAAPTLTTCSTDCPNRDATVNDFKTTGSFSPSRGMFSAVAARAETLPALELETLKPNRCLTECSHDDANKVTHVVVLDASPLTTAQLNNILCNTSPCAMPWVCEDTDDEQIRKGGVMQPLWPPRAPPSTWQLRFVEHTIANSTELKPWPDPWMSKSSGSGSRDKPPWAQNAVSVGKSDKLRELYEKSGSSWRLTKSGTPGTIGSFEDIRCANNVMQYSPVTTALFPVFCGGHHSFPRPCYKERCSFLQISQLYVGLSCVNMTNQKLGLTEFPEDSRFTNVESALVALHCKECLFLADFEKSIDLDASRNCSILAAERKKAEFKSGDLVQDLGRIIKGSVEPVRDLLSQFDYALGALGALVLYDGLLADDTNYGNYTIEKYNLDCYLRLASAVVRTLNIVEEKTDGNNKFSLFAFMNRVCTARMGQGLLNKWLYVNEVNNRLDMVQAFTENPELRRGLRQQLTRISDLDRLTHTLHKKSANQPVVKLYQSCSRISYIKGVLQQYNGQFSRFRTRFLGSFEEWITENRYVPYVRPDITTSEGGDILLQGGWHPYKVQSVENYMKLSMGNITRAFLELHISPSGQPD
ncbi:uncharacterized protein LOC119276640 [Triticum dicoccoides]|uniref:uncharacterized protein LOC119276640 n=1 Tax=Triticum dicoccoides TaxID=85692 RepID=UPI000E7B74E7|nr:uncharacterized protein LOC119276640 [Triticum dicoccoides]XP_037413663.1 uncharacterized protein LOC119276640 [Triticum dicoccoides]